jgi:hypothetical protein
MWEAFEVFKTPLFPFLAPLSTPIYQKGKITAHSDFYHFEKNKYNLNLLKFHLYENFNPEVKDYR